MSSLMGGGTKSTSTSVKNVPDWALGPLKQSLQMATDAANTPYESYDAQRYADFTPDELQSQQMTRDLIGQYSGNYSQANDAMGQVMRSGTEGFSQDYLNNYINPYRENVLDVAKRRNINNFDQQMNDYKAKAAQTSSFGGSRSGLAQAQMYKDFQQNLADQETQGLASSYESALNQANLGMNRAYTGANGLMNTASQGQSYGLRDAAALSTVGEAQRAMNQQGLDWNYEQWANEKAYPYQQAQFLSSIASPIAGQVTGDTTTQQTKKQSSILGTALAVGSMAMGIPGVGAALGGLGASAGFGGTMMSMGGSLASGATNQIGNSLISQLGSKGLYAEGGVVSKYADGGLMQGISDYYDTPGALIARYLQPDNQYAQDFIDKQANNPMIKGGNSIAEWAKENPTDAASVAMAVPTLGSSLVGTIPSLLKGGASAGAKGLPALASLIAKHPNLAASLGIGAIQGADMYSKSSEGLQQATDVQTASDLSKAQDYAMFISTGGKAGRDATSDAERAKYENIWATNPDMHNMASNLIGKQQKQQVPENVLTNQGGVNTESANASNITEGLASVQDSTSKQSSEGINRPLMAFGAALLSGDGDFFTNLGQGLQAYMGQQDAEKKAAATAQEEQLKQMLDMYKAQTGRMQAQAYSKQVDNPYKAQLDALKVKDLEQKTAQGGTKFRDNLISTLIKTGMTDDPVKAAQDIMDQLNASDMTSSIDDTQIPWGASLSQ